MTRPSDDDDDNEDTPTDDEQSDAVPHEDAKATFSGLSDEARERIAERFRDFMGSSQLRV